MAETIFDQDPGLHNQAEDERDNNLGGNGFDLEGWEIPSEQPWPILDPAAFHGLAGDIVRAIEPISEADPVAVLVQFLATAGCALGRGPYYQVGETRHHPNLFAALCGITSKGRKGTSYDPIQALVQDVAPDWAKNNIKSGLASGEGIIHCVHDDIWMREKVPQGGKGKPPTYELVLKEESVADKRILVIEAEFGQLLSVMQRPGNSLSPIIRLAWDGRKLQTVSKHFGETATDAHIAIAGHITIEEIRRGLTSLAVASGFANRFLFVLVRRSKELPFPGRLATEVAARFTEKLRSILDNSVIRREIIFHAQTRELWTDEYLALSAEKMGLFGYVVGRAEAQVIRLAMLYALLDQTYYIEPAHLRAALALWRYCEASARYIFGEALGDPIADEIFDALRRAGPDGMTRTEIRNLFSGNQSSEAVGAALRLLLRHNKVRRSHKASRGRHAEVWIA
jgi:hypothetical protein